MKRPGIIPFSILAALLLVVLGFAMASPGQSKAAGTSAPPKQTGGQLEYFTRTLVMGQAGTTGLNVGWLKVSGDWVGYATQSVGCGHCGLYITGMSFINVLTNEKKTIKPSTWGYQYSSGGAPQGVFAVKMYAPYVVWSQPGKKVPGEGYNFTPGDFDCTICYYNLETKQGGAVSSLQGLDPDRASLVHVMDVDYTGRVLARVHGASDLWAGKIGENTSELIKTGLAPDKISEAVFALFGRYAWISEKVVYINDPEAGAGKMIGSGASDLVSPGLYFFWHTDAGMQTYDGDPTGNNPNSRGKTIIPEATASYDVQLTTNLGDIAAWVTFGDDGAYDLKVAGFNILGGSSTILEWKQKSWILNVSLGQDKLVYLESEPNGGLPIIRIQLVWLLNPDPAFAQVWSKADQPVALGAAARSWLWGPKANFMGKEQYVEGQSGSRLVRYYDKSRMEVNNPNGNKNDPYYITNGLLVTEMIAGEIQLGDNTFVKASVPVTIPVAGDPRKDNPLTPSYDALKGVSSLHGENQAPNRVGQQVDGALDVNGTVSVDAAHRNLAKYAAFSPQTGHNIPDLFWTYLQKMPADYGFDWTFVLGYPISEAYWTTMRVGGEDMPVMIQAYQRRVLTYVPDFDPNWRVQMGNVGQHYYEWRYVLNH